MGDQDEILARIGDVDAARDDISERIIRVQEILFVVVARTGFDEHDRAIQLDPDERSFWDRVDIDQGAIRAEEPSDPFEGMNHALVLHST